MRKKKLLMFNMNEIEYEKKIWVKANRSLMHACIDLKDQTFGCSKKKLRRVKNECWKTHFFWKESPSQDQANFRQTKWRNCNTTSIWNFSGNSSRLELCEASYRYCHFYMRYCSNSRNRHFWQLPSALSGIEITLNTCSNQQWEVPEFQSITRNKSVSLKIFD